MSYKRCSVPLCDIRQLLPLSDNSINITEIPSILLKTDDKFTHTGSINSLKRKQKNSSLMGESMDSVFDSGDDEELPVEKPKKRIVKSLSDSEEKSVESDSGDDKSDSVSDSSAGQKKKGVLKHKGQKKENQSKKKRGDRKHKEQKEKKAKYKEKREDRNDKDQNEKKAKYDIYELDPGSDYGERSTDSNSDSEEDEPDSDYEKYMNPYEKLIEKKRKENVAFLETLEIDKVKADFSEPLKKDRKPVSKAVYPPASRKSKRAANVILNYSEEKLLRDVWGKVKRDVLYADKIVRPGKRSKRLADKDYDFSEFFE